ncbi:chromosomal replication initiator protein DnaA [Gloeocapsa sp. PCC 73106]|uniref:chromosomal replication initiator protein DnaA n=1 Tax=Gloeocapsa sp. PCC 73106 TaxID=102232 RepID=UPI0002ACC786|nr:chromosomal replication initiator protein DnaA [Gloeocapsa sp. PCC 73106]ELR99142.1 chromosomal replication initiator protein DnaA [Gloeocapsa sp. PCC 73106]
MKLEIEALWNLVLESLRQQLSGPTFETWIETALPVSWHNNILVIKIPNRFVLNHVHKNYLKMIGKTVQVIVCEPVEIQLITADGENRTIYPDFEEESNFNQVLPNKLNPKYTFYRFVVGPTNRMAHAASLSVAESPGRDFNPLFLCGGVGLGKTHLMQAIGHYHLEINSNARVFYVSTEQFTNDLIAAIRNDSMENFREHYRSADILLIDDIQFIEGKEYTQEEFFHTFNTLHEAGKQIILASDRPPHQIRTLQERLISRFSMGLIADIQVPDLETRMAILQKKAEYENIKLSREIVEYIATQYTSNIRELEGAFIRAIAHLSISGLPMTVENVATILCPQVQPIVTTPEVILHAISETFNLSVEELKSSSRRREISLARQIGMYLMRQYTDLSFPRIGEVFGGKDHTTVLYSCEKINQLQQKDQQIAQKLSQLSDRISLLNRH